jgi:isopenicillin N synthase-like dioxygenase
MIPNIDAKALADRDPNTLQEICAAAKDIGFLTLSNTDISKEEVLRTLQAYRDFFKSSDENKQKIDSLNVAYLPTAGVSLLP